MFVDSSWACSGIFPEHPITWLWYVAVLRLLQMGRCQEQPFPQNVPQTITHPSPNVSASLTQYWAWPSPHCLQILCLTSANGSVNFDSLLNLTPFHPFRVNRKGCCANSWCWHWWNNIKMSPTNVHYVCRWVVHSWFYIVCMDMWHQKNPLLVTVAVIKWLCKWQSFGCDVTHGLPSQGWSALVPVCCTHSCPPIINRLAQCPCNISYWRSCVQHANVMFTLHNFDLWHQYRS